MITDPRSDQSMAVAAVVSSQSETAQNYPRQDEEEVGRASRRRRVHLIRQDCGGDRPRRLAAGIASPPPPPPTMAPAPLRCCKRRNRPGVDMRAVGGEGGGSSTIVGGTSSGNDIRMDNLSAAAAAVSAIAREQSWLRACRSPASAGTSRHRQFHVLSIVLLWMLLSTVVGPALAVSSEDAAAATVPTITTRAASTSSSSEVDLLHDPKEGRAKQATLRRRVKASTTGVRNSGYGARRAEAAATEEGQDEEEDQEREEELFDDIIAKVTADEQAATALLSDVLQSRAKAQQPQAARQCAQRYRAQKCTACQKAAEKKFTTGRCVGKKCLKTFKRCRKKKVQKRCGADEAMLCAAPEFRTDKSTLIQGQSDGDDTGEGEGEVDISEEKDCNILFYAQEYPSSDTISLNLAMENKCDLTWSVPRVQMDICLQCPASQKQCSTETIYRDDDKFTLGAYDERELIIPMLEEVDMECTYSANFSAIFEASNEEGEVTHKYIRECRRHHEGMTPKCLDLPLQVFYDRFEVYITMEIDEGLEEKLQLNKLKKSVERALLKYFADLEACEFGTEECGARAVLAATIDEVVDVTDGDVEDGGGGRRILQAKRPRGKKKKKRKFKMKGKRRSSGRCRAVGTSCRSREQKADDSISPPAGRRRMQQQQHLIQGKHKHQHQHQHRALGGGAAAGNETLIIQDYDLIVQNGCFRTPNLFLSLRAEGVNLVQDASVASISEVDCSSPTNCGTDDACCGIKGCDCTPEMATPNNCVVGSRSQLPDGTFAFETCVLEGPDKTNLCCEEVEECPPMWEMQVCASRCEDMAAEIAPRKQCRLDLDASVIPSADDKLTFNWEMTNACATRGLMMELTMALYVACPGQDPYWTQPQSILANMNIQTGSVCIQSYETVRVPVPVQVQFEVDKVCDYAARFAATFEAGKHRFVENIESETIRYP